MPGFDEPTTQETYNSEEDKSIDTSTKAFIKRKVRNFSEKYNKGKLIGTGPFGQVYTCWLKDG